MKLLLLRCPHCQAPLQPENVAVLVGCSNCWAAVALDEAGLRLIKVNYAAANFKVQPNAKGVEWVPFWVFNGRVHIKQRETQGGGGFFGGGSDGTFWDIPRQLYVPAWDLPMPMAREIGQKFTQEQVQLQAMTKPPETHLVSAAITPDDALKLLEFIVLSIEAQRKDWLKKLQFRIEAEAPELWALPARRQGSKWAFPLAGS